MTEEKNTESMPVRNHKGMGPLGRPSHRWYGKIKMGLKIIGSNEVD
jgi:hypothetical protein